MVSKSLKGFCLLGMICSCTLFQDFLLSAMICDLMKFIICSPIMYFLYIFLNVQSRLSDVLLCLIGHPKTTEYNFLCFQGSSVWFHYGLLLLTESPLSRRKKSRALTNKAINNYKNDTIWKPMQYCNAYLKLKVVHE